MPHARGALSAKRKRVLKPSLVLVSTVSCRLEKLFYIISLPPPKLVTMLSIVKKNCLRVAHQNFEASYKDINYLASDPALNSIRKEKHFQSLLRPYSPQNRIVQTLAIFA